MNLTHLRYALEVERTGSITRAAKNLFMGQPNLSKAIRELEADMGAEIFRRTRWGMEPTQAGSQILAYAKSILAQIDTLESLYRPGTRDVFRLSVSAPKAVHFPGALERFLAGAPEDVALDVRYREASPSDALNHVADGEAGIAVVRYEKKHESYYMGLIRRMRLRYEPLWDFAMRLLMARDHPLAREEDLTAAMLAGYTQILHGDAPAALSGPVSCDIPSRAVAQGSRSLCVGDAGSQLRLLGSLKGAYLWSSPPPPSALEEYGLIVRRPAMPEIAGRDVLIYREDHILTRNEHDFVEIVRQCERESVSE